MNGNDKQDKRVKDVGRNSTTNENDFRDGVFGKHECHDGHTTNGEHPNGARAHGTIQELETQNGTRSGRREVGIEETSKKDERFGDGYGNGTLFIGF